MLSHLKIKAKKFDQQDSISKTMKYNDWDATSCDVTFRLKKICESADEKNLIVQKFFAQIFCSCFCVAMRKETF